MDVICAVYDEKGKQLYLGTASREAENIAKSTEGISYFKMYHRVKNSVCINENVFSGGEEIAKNLRYIPKSEIEILTETLSKDS